jgi:hypothetical protein
LIFACRSPNACSSYPVHLPSVLWIFHSALGEFEVYWL